MRLSAEDGDTVGYCTTVVFAFGFQCRSVSVAYLKE